MEPGRPNIWSGHTMDVKVDPARLEDADALSRLLQDRGVITQQERELARMQSRATGIAFWRVLLNLNLCSADLLQSVVQSAGLVADARAVVEQQSAGLAVRQTLCAAIEEGDVPALVERLFEQAVLARATDIHFEPYEGRSLRVRLRIDGILHDVATIPGQFAVQVVSRIKLLAGLNIVEKRDPQDGHIVFAAAGAPRNLRIASVPTNRGERIVARIIDQQSSQVRLDELGMAPEHVAAVTRWLHSPFGIVAVTGPVGSGKTTTLYACLNHLNLGSRNLMTVEDPVEYELCGVSQLQVDPKIGWTFPKALRAILRQDPDVIMVGEIRDDETAQIAVRAALTGGLVLTTMHANDAPGAVGTFYSYGVPGYLVAQSLLGVIAQRLVRKIHPAACVEYAPDEAMRRLLRLQEGERPDLKLKRGCGTAADFGTGYLGRTGLFEVLELTESMRDLIHREPAKGELRRVAIENGMQPLAMHGVEKVLEGITSLEEAYQVILL